MVSDSFNFNSAKFELVNTHTMRVTPASGKAVEYDFKNSEVRSEGNAPTPFEKVDGALMTIMRTQMIALDGDVTPAYKAVFVDRSGWNPTTGC